MPNLFMKGMADLCRISEIRAPNITCIGWYHAYMYYVQLLVWLYNISDISLSFHDAFILPLSHMQCVVFMPVAVAVILLCSAARIHATDIIAQFNQIGTYLQYPGCIV